MLHVIQCTLLIAYFNYKTTYKNVHTFMHFCCTFVAKVAHEIREADSADSENRGSSSKSRLDALTHNIQHIPMPYGEHSR